MAKWEIPNNRDRKLIRERREALQEYFETDDTPIDEDSAYGDIKRRAKALLEKGEGPW